MQELETRAVERIADLHAESTISVAGSQRGIERIVDVIGTPLSALVILAAVVLWIGGNLLLGSHAIDRPPFPWLQTFAGLAALLMTVLILTAENRTNQADLRRARLTLQIALLAEAKTAKIIELLERMRMESPVHSSEPDPLAAAMSEPADPQRMMHTIDKAHERAESEAKSAN